jgi:glyoxylase-like metal-dependent hydrolase (beta-lactamase superfamily II)
VVTRFADTCNVWVLTRGREAVCVDFGSGAVLDALDELGVDRITDVLVTHFHRDGTAGLARAVEHGARVWVPPQEVAFFTEPDRLRRQRRSQNSYDVHQDWFAPLEPVAIAGVVAEYRTRVVGGFDTFTLPSPGHTMGSVTYLVDVDGELLGFSGDLIAGPGQVWSTAALQWSYTGTEGLDAAILSCGTLARREPAALLPAHGERIDDPKPALALTAERLAELAALRRPSGAGIDHEGWLDAPWREISAHVLLNRTSISCAYALLSETGNALLFDWGYDLWTGADLGADRHLTRPLLESIGALKRDHGVERIEAIVPTHYHDDHVAGANLLRDVEGTEIWAPEPFARILEQPERYAMPCVWFDPIPVDRVLRVAETVRWHEYELRVHPLPGHTRYAAAIEAEVDGQRVLATGDQQSREESGAMVANYQYANRFQIRDYVKSAFLYEQVRPDLLLTGHWGAHPFDEDDLNALFATGYRVEELHRELLPIPDAEGFFVRLVPYRLEVRAGEVATIQVEASSPLQGPVVVELVAPPGWHVEPGRLEVADGPLYAEAKIAPDASGTLLANVTIGGRPFGAHGELQVTVT